MRLYLDASVLVPTLVADAFTARAFSLVASSWPVLLVSDFAAAEFATLRAPDALNIAIAQRTGAALANFDEKMAAAAHALGLAVET